VKEKCNLVSLNTGTVMVYNNRRATVSKDEIADVRLFVLRTSSSPSTASRGGNGVPMGRVIHDLFARPFAKQNIYAGKLADL
jgi:hypothetical protein